MNNFVPNSDVAREELVQQNQLYLELLERRNDASCFNCDYCKGSAEICADCLHNYEDDFELKPVEAVKKEHQRVSRIRRNFLSHKCPVCENPNWTNVIAAYFDKKEGGIKVGEMVAKFCPFCGQDLVAKRKLDAKEDKENTEFVVGEIQFEEL